MDHCIQDLVGLVKGACLTMHNARRKTAPGPAEVTAKEPDRELTEDDGQHSMLQDGALKDRF